MKPLADAEIPVFIALGRKVAEEGSGTERQKANAKAWADAAKVAAADPNRHAGMHPALTGIFRQTAFAGGMGGCVRRV